MRSTARIPTLLRAARPSFALAALLLMPGCSSGGADGSSDLRGVHTNVRDGGADLGPAAAPASFLSPSVTTAQAVWPREVVYTLDAPQAATIHYTLDGSEPMPGAAGTRSGKNPLVLDRPLGDGTLRWFADYGARFQAEPARTFVARVDSTRPRTDMGSLTERVVFAQSGGPVVVIREGEVAELSGALIFQAWRSAPTGTCPGCQLQYVLFLEKDAVAPITCVDQVHQFGVYPGKAQSLPFTIKAPLLTPGRHVLRAGLTLQPSCNGTAPVTYADVGLVVVQRSNEPPI